MAAPNMIITESDHTRFTGVLERLGRESNSKFAFLLDKAGQQIAFGGDISGIDSTALASLTAGNVAATEGVAQLVGEEEFTSLFHEGRHDNLHITVVRDRFILLVVFDERSSLGLVRLRVDQHVTELAGIIDEILARIEADATGPSGSVAAFAQITEEDIDALFGS